MSCPVTSFGAAAGTSNDWNRERHAPELGPTRPRRTQLPLRRISPQDSELGPSEHPSGSVAAAAVPAVVSAALAEASTEDSATVVRSRPAPIASVRSRLADQGCAVPGQKPLDERS